jgi:hypothetical protein
MRYTWFFPACFVVYLALSAAAIWAINLNLPSWLETALNIFAAPGVLALFALTPVLRKLGLTSGEMVTTPTFLGFVVSLCIYFVVAYGLAKLCNKR